MRPPRKQHNEFKYPLDHILGSSAQVRLLRVLVHDVGGPVSVTDAARMAGLSTMGTRKALKALERMGIAVRVGTGRAQKFGLKKDNPYYRLLLQLFDKEYEEYEFLIQQLRQVVDMPEIREAWIRDLGETGERQLTLDVITETRALSWISPEMRSRLLEIEKHSDIIIEVNTFTRADSPTPPDNAIMLRTSGDRQKNEKSKGTRTRSESSQCSRKRGRFLADLIRSDPSLIKRAIKHTNRLLREDQGIAASDIGEWRTLLETYSPERIMELLVSRSSRAERLRRSSPFGAVLTPEERDYIMQKMDSKP